MMNLRSVGALLAISAVLSCATAINDGTVPGPPTATAGSGSDSGGGPGDEGGGPAAGGAPQEAGAPGIAGKASGGSSTGSAGKGSGGSTTGSGGSTTGSGGTVGVAGSSTGGKAGTGSSTGGASSAGAGGGTPVAGYCDNPVDLPATATNTGSVGKAAACFRAKVTFNAITCSNMDADPPPDGRRTVKVNGMLATCGTKAEFPPAIDGWSYFEISAGTFDWAQVGWYNG
ncbi:MAG TPA: hypothetical protein VGC79_08585 [Polyangiaceae bacterium]